MICYSYVLATNIDVRSVPWVVGCWSFGDANKKLVWLYTPFFKKKCKCFQGFEDIKCLMDCL